ncbi:MAG: GGDEF domain-containing protein [Gammaproteobacteria bacterium]|nr:GGDEF domain-containing protein [Gammaproteobacteria bacterium]
MEALDRDVLEQLVAGSAEPVLVARVDSADWPVVLSNPAFDGICPDGPAVGKPFADVVEPMLGRDLAVELSETIRAGQETSIPVERSGREYLLSLLPLGPLDSSTRYYAAYWRSSASTAGGATRADTQRALLQARRRVRDLTREDPVTGLMNTAAFRDVLSHDWAVAAREQSALGLVVLELNDFDAYFEVFGRHATDSCLRRVAQAIRRCLRRASDVAARLDGANGGKLIVLSHGSNEEGVHEFAGRIAAAVRGLGLHHPRSKVERFVTVSYEVTMLKPGSGKVEAAAVLERLVAD